MKTGGIALPARLGSLSLTLGPEKGVTPLEDYVARAVQLGCTTVDELEGLFLLDRTIVLDAVHGLWTKGHVVVDFEQSVVDLSEGARKLLTDPNGSLADSAVD